MSLNVSISLQMIIESSSNAIAWHVWCIRRHIFTSGSQ